MHSGKQILKSTSVISFFTGVSRLLGLVREILMARFFGTTLAQSAFNIAFALPNLFRAVLGEGALNAALVPVYTEALENEGEEKANKLAASIFSLIGSLLIVIVGIGLALLLALSSVDLGEKWNSVVSLSCITLPYVLFICLAALCMGVFHSRGKFWVPAAAQGLLNVVWILVLAAMFVVPALGTLPGERIFAVAWAVIVAGVVQLAFQAVFLKRNGFNPRINFDWTDSRVKRFLALMTPVALGAGVTQLNVFVSKMLAMSVGEWAPAALGYADRLIYLPLGVVATALGSVLLPTFSRQAVALRHDALVKTLEASIRHICLVMMPIAAAMFALALPVVVLLFRAGEFDDESAMFTTRALLAYAPGLVVFSILKMVVPAFYAMKDTRTPVIVAVYSAVLNLIMNVLSIRYLPEGYQHVGLAGSVVVSSVFAVAALLFVFNRRVGGMRVGRLLWSLISTLISGAIMVVATTRIYALISSSSWFVVSCDGKLCQLAAIAMAGSAGLLVYGIARFAVNREETMAVLRIVMSREKR